MRCLAILLFLIHPAHATFFNCDNHYRMTIAPGEWTIYYPDGQTSGDKFLDFHGQVMPDGTFGWEGNARGVWVRGRFDGHRYEERRVLPPTDVTMTTFCTRATNEIPNRPPAQRRPQRPNYSDPYTRGPRHP